MKKNQAIGVIGGLGIAGAGGYLIYKLWQGRQIQVSQGDRIGVKFIWANGSTAALTPSFRLDMRRVAAILPTSFVYTWQEGDILYPSNTVEGGAESEEMIVLAKPVPGDWGEGVEIPLSSEGDPIDLKLVAKMPWGSEFTVWQKDQAARVIS